MIKYKRISIYCLLPLVVFSSYAEPSVGNLGDMSLADYVFLQFGVLIPLLFKVYNYGILAALSAVAMFTIVFGGAVAAADGSGFSRKINSWVLIRTMGGAVLLVPTGPNNYALIQKLVMAVASYGVIAVNSLLGSVGDVMADDLLSSMNKIELTKHYDVVKKNEKVIRSFDDIVDLALAAQRARLEYILNPLQEGSLVENINNVEIRVSTELNYQDPSEPPVSFMQPPRTYIRITYQLHKNGVGISDSILGGFIVENKVANPLLNGKNVQRATKIAELMKAVLRKTESDFERVDEDILHNNIRSISELSTLEPGQINAILGKDKGARSATDDLEYQQIKKGLGYVENKDCGKSSVVCFNNKSLGGEYRNYFQNIFEQQNLTYLDACIGSGCDITEAGGISKDEFPYNMSFQTMVTYLPKVINAVLNMGLKPDDAVPDMINTHIQSKPFYFTRLDGDSKKVPTHKTAKSLNCTDLGTELCQLKFQQYLKYNVIHKIQQSYLSESVTGRLPDSALLPLGDPTRSMDRTSGDVKTMIGGLQSHTSGRSLEQESSVWIGSKDRLNVIPRETNKMLASILEAISGCTSAECSGSGIFTYNRAGVVLNPIDFLKRMGASFYTAGLAYNNDAVRGNGGVVSVDDEIAKRLYGGTVGVLIPTRAVSTGIQSAGPMTPWGRGGVAASEGAAALSISAFEMQVEKEIYKLYKFESLGSSLSALFMIWGSFLGIFLPLVPFMVVFFSFVGWVLLLVEVMLASPLVALGLAHPNSQQFLGAADQVLMMLLLVSLRPIMIVVAIFFAGVISYTALFFLNEGMIHLLHALNLSNPSNGTNIAVFIASMLVYSYVAFMAVIQSYSIIGSLPDKVSSWIGMGPLGGTSPIQQLLSMRSQFEGGMQQAAQGASGMGSKAKQMARSVSKAKMEAGLKQVGRGRLFGISKTVSKAVKSTNSQDTRRQLEKLGLSGSLLSKAEDICNSDWTESEKISALKSIRTEWSLTGQSLDDKIRNYNQTLASGQTGVSTQVSAEDRQAAGNKSGTERGGEALISGLTTLNPAKIGAGAIFWLGHKLFGSRGNNNDPRNPPN